MRDERFLHIKSVIESQSQLICRPLSTENAFEIISEATTNPEKRKKLQLYIKTAISKLNAQRGSNLKSIFTQQAITHVIFQLLDSEKSISKVYNLKSKEEISTSQYERFSVLPYPRLVKHSQLLLESRKLPANKVQKLQESLEKYKRARSRNMLLKKLYTKLSESLNLTEIDNNLLTPNSELSNAISELLSLSVRVSAKVAGNQQKLIDKQ